MTIANYEDDWAEKWQGLLTRNADGETNYDNQANQLFAKNLKGKLLLAHGTMDTNVRPTTRFSSSTNSSKPTRISISSCCPTADTASATNPTWSAAAGIISSVI